MDFSLAFCYNYSGKFPLYIKPKQHLLCCFLQKPLWPWRQCNTGFIPQQDFPLNSRAMPIVPNNRKGKVCRWTINHTLDPSISSKVLYRLISLVHLAQTTRTLYSSVYTCVWSMLWVFSSIIAHRIIFQQHGHTVNMSLVCSHMKGTHVKAVTRVNTGC